MYNPWGFGFGGLLGAIGLFFVVLVAWSIYWKGRALWLAARKGSLYWFIGLLVINTAGILEILYIYYFSKQDCCGGGKKGGDCCKEDKGKDEDCCGGCGHDHK